MINMSLCFGGHITVPQNAVYNFRYFDLKTRGLYICDTFSAYNPNVIRLRFLLHLAY